MSVRDWKLLDILSNTTARDIGLLVLNQPLKSDQAILQHLWLKAVIRATVDGGTNELYDCMGAERDKFIPDVISGDFDSIQKPVLQFYKDKGSDIVRTEDQNFTDFTKCFKLLRDKYADREVSAYCVLGAFGGRLDQVFANIDTLFTLGKLTAGVPVYLLSHHSIACLLPKGSHKLDVNTGNEGEWCGLIPVGGACECVTTTGLKWNLDKQQLKFGELISTSNTWADSTTEVVTIETDGPLLWTMGVKFVQ